MIHNAQNEAVQVLERGHQAGVAMKEWLAYHEHVSQQQGSTSMASAAASTL